MKQVYYVPITLTVIEDSAEKACDEAMSYLAIADRLIEREAVRGAVVEGQRITRAAFPIDPTIPAEQHAPQYNVWTSDDNVDEWHVSKEDAIRDYVVRCQSIARGTTITLTEYPNYKPNGECDAQVFNQLFSWSKAL